MSAQDEPPHNCVQRTAKETPAKKARLILWWEWSGTPAHHVTPPTLQTPHTCSLPEFSHLRSFSVKQQLNYYYTSPIFSLTLERKI